MREGCTRDGVECRHTKACTSDPKTCGYWSCRNKLTHIGWYGSQADVLWYLGGEHVATSSYVKWSSALSGWQLQMTDLTFVPMSVANVSLECHRKYLANLFGATFD